MRRGASWSRSARGPLSETPPVPPAHRLPPSAKPALALIVNDCDWKSGMPHAHPSRICVQTGHSAWTLREEPQAWGLGRTRRLRNSDRSYPTPCALPWTSLGAFLWTLQSPEPSKGPRASGMLASRPAVLKAPVWSDRGAEARRPLEGAPPCPHLPSEPRASGHEESGQDGRPLETESAAGGVRSEPRCSQPRAPMPPGVAARSVGQGHGGWGAV